jgi:hypothetical protein
VHEEQNALNERIDEDDILSSQDTSHQISTDLREVSSHPLSSVIGDSKEGVRIKSKRNKIIVHYAFVSQLEFENFKDVNNDSH